MREYDNDFNQDDYYSERYSGAAREDTTDNIPKAGGKQYVLTKKAVAIITAVCILFSGSFGLGGAYIMSKSQPGGSVTFYTSQSQAGDNGLSIDIATVPGSTLTVKQIVEKAADAIVEINTELVTSDFWNRTRVTPGAGSGVIVSADGYVITNNHVISQANKVTVTLKDGTEYEAKFIGADAQADVAVLKIEAKGLTPVVFGDSDKLSLGDPAVVIGNPLGKLGGTVTSGIISSLDRQLSIGGQNMTLLQTDASINRGNSGGGLFNQYGEIIGLVVAKSEGVGVEGIGFAIPINIVKDVATQLIESGFVAGRPMIGITMIDLTGTQEAVQYGVRHLGVYISSVDSENAKKAGFQEWDMLYFIEDVRIERPQDLTDALKNYKVGDVVTITVVRDNSILEIEVELSERKQ